MGTKHHRLPHEAYKGEVCVSFTLCLQARRNFFVHPGIVDIFVNLIAKIATNHAFDAIYCFMPDHLHLILFGKSNETDLLQAVRDFKQRTGYWLARHHTGIGWQKSYYDRVLRTQEIRGHVAYVLDNPIRRSLVRDWRNYPFIGAVGRDLEDFVNDM